ncbi:Uncharacterised protein [Mycobacteroides abscessus subsp. abscessus]|nr:Uncharacterised protein [Mycobacteroides abscessus subsp. abscessus]
MYSIPVRRNQTGEKVATGSSASPIRISDVTDECTLMATKRSLRVRPTPIQNRSSGSANTSTGSAPPPNVYRRIA